MIAEKDFQYWDQRLANDAFLRGMRWWWWHYTHGSLKSQLELLRLRQAREAEDQVAERIRALGYGVYATTPNCPFDLWVCDAAGRAARVEVKLSTCHDNKGRARFQVDVRSSQSADCDLLVWIARNGRDWHYIIPMSDLGSHRNLAIWSQCPGNYRGKWSSYLEAWDHLRRVVANTHPRIWQASMPLAQGGTA
jgi:hypothetical protein